MNLSIIHWLNDLVANTRRVYPYINMTSVAIYIAQACAYTNYTNLLMHNRQVSQFTN